MGFVGYRNLSGSCGMADGTGPGWGRLKVTLGAAGEAGSQLPLFTGSFLGTSFGSRDLGKIPLCFKRLKEADGGLPAAADHQ